MWKFCNRIGSEVFQGNPDCREKGTEGTVVHGYGNFTIGLDLKFFINSIYNPSLNIKNYGLRYPIQIRNRLLSCKLAKTFGNVYFASRGKSCGYFAFSQTRLFEVVT